MMGEDAAVVIEALETHARTGFVDLRLPENGGYRDYRLPVTHVKVFGWYDNEMGSYTYRLGELTVTWPRTCRQESSPQRPGSRRSPEDERQFTIARSADLEPGHRPRLTKTARPRRPRVQVQHAVTLLDAGDMAVSGDHDREAVVWPGLAGFAGLCGGLRCLRQLPPCAPRVYEFPPTPPLHGRAGSEPRLRDRSYPVRR